MVNYSGVNQFYDLLSEDISNLIHEKLLSCAFWKISTNNLPINEFQKKHDKADNGLILCSYEKNNNIDNSFLQELNFYANIILQLCLKKMQFNDVIVKRIFWNYYHNTSIGTYHPDSLQKNHWSIIFYINNSPNSGTYIKIEPEGELLIPHETGSAILFPSYLVHAGKMPEENKHRCCLNIVFEASIPTNIK